MQVLATGNREVPFFYAIYFLWGNCSANAYEKSRKKILSDDTNVIYSLTTKVLAENIENS